MFIELNYFDISDLFFKKESCMSKYEIKEMIDSGIYRTYNFLAELSFCFSVDRELAKRNLIFKNIHNNDTCYILGTGPSLKNVDLSFLEDQIVFGLNYLHKSEIINNIKPKYYCLYDEIFHGQNIDDTKEIIKKLPETTFFVRTKAYEEFKKKGIDKSNIFYQACNVFQYGEHISVDMTKNMTAPYNVVLGCIQTALYMGFSEIYLLGCDYNSFASLKVEHCYDEKDNIPSRHMSLGYEMKYYTLVTYHHYALEKYSRKNNMKIYNITDNSLLDAYERKDCKSHIDSIRKK